MNQDLQKLLESKMPKKKKVPNGNYSTGNIDEIMNICGRIGFNRCRRFAIYALPEIIKAYDDWKVGEKEKKYPNHKEDSRIVKSTLNRWIKYQKENASLTREKKLLESRLKQIESKL